MRTLFVSLLNNQLLNGFWALLSHWATHGVDNLGSDLIYRYWDRELGYRLKRNGMSTYHNRNWVKKMNKSNWIEPNSLYLSPLFFYIKKIGWKINENLTTPPPPLFFFFKFYNGKRNLFDKFTVPTLLNPTYEWCETIS